MKMRIAVIDDEPIVGHRLKKILEKDGYEVESFTSAESFFPRLARPGFHLVFTDLRMPDIDGMTVLERIKKINEETEIIIMTGYVSISTVIEAIKKGAYHYIAKPIKLDEIRMVTKNAVEKICLRSENRSLREALTRRDSPAGIVGTSPAIQNVFALIRKVAAVDCNVLIQGKSGTGKELVARAVHSLSPRRAAPFVSFNCGGFTEELIGNELFGHEKGSFTGATATKIGLIESGAGGTVFLDEIGEMPASMQVKLLHVIQEKRILRVGGVKPVRLDIRIIAATNRDLKEEVKAGHFREDLFYRLNVVTIQIPPLAERRDDVPLLISHFIEKYNQAFGKKVKGVAPATLAILMSYDFPGNVRELKNIIERAVALADDDRLQPGDLPPDIQKLELDSLVDSEPDTLEEIEKRYIAAVLKKSNYNKNIAAKVLGLPRTTLWRKLKKHGLDNVTEPPDSI
ncbi:MAG: sigma-54-dependent Fis family transcriptional regulator [Deltaproteobacteria bacterium]|nr:sigma-54-dependent Fis family transcriptional regulator [Deltaproteobacteria bacterium]